MKVNFNNVRKQALFAYDDLVNLLNAAIVTSDDQYAKIPTDTHDSELNIKGFVLIDSEDILKPLNDLRFMLSAISMTYEEGNPDFKDVYEECFPEPEVLSYFNKKE